MRTRAGCWGGSPPWSRKTNLSLDRAKKDRGRRGRTSTRGLERTSSVSRRPRTPPGTSNAIQGGDHVPGDRPAIKGGRRPQGEHGDRSIRRPIVRP
jgi:hypothetical protein